MAAPREVRWSIGAVDRTRRVLRRIRNGFRRLVRSIVSVRGAIAGVFAGAAIRGLTSFAEGLENIQDQAEGLGLTTEEMQALIYAAREVGVSGNDIETVFQRLGRRAGQAADGNELLIEKFQGLGVSFEDLKRKNSIQLFDQLLASMRKLPRAVGEARIADILDTEGLRLFRRINPEFRDFADILDRARAGGAILDDSVLKRMEEAARTLREFGDKLTIVFAPRLADFIAKITPYLPGIAEAMGRFADQVGAFVASVNQFVNAHPDLTDPLGAAQRAGESVRNRLLHGGSFTTPGRQIDKLIEYTAELVEINRRNERRANTTPESGVYGP